LFIRRNYTTGTRVVIVPGTGSRTCLVKQYLYDRSLSRGPYLYKKYIDIYIYIKYQEKFFYHHRVPPFLDKPFATHNCGGHGYKVMATLYRFVDQSWASSIIKDTFSTAAFAKNPSQRIEFNWGNRALIMTLDIGKIWRKNLEHFPYIFYRESES